MKKSRFRIVSIMVVLSLTVLTAVEALWAWKMYDSQRESMRRHIEDMFDSVIYRHAVLAMTVNGRFMSAEMFERFDTAVGEELHAAGIDLGYAVEILSLTDSEPIVIMCSRREPLQGGIICVDRPSPPLVVRLSIEDPQSVIIGSMGWILAVSAAIVVLVAFTFVYLLRTLFRAKSIERMRRDLTHNITHELKTPIAVAYAAGDTLRSMPSIADDPVSRGEYVDMILSQLTSLTEMVERILQMSLDEHARTPIDGEECRLRAVVDQVRRAMEMKYPERGICWTLDVAEDAAVVADRMHLVGMMTNLADNAVKYSAGRPQIDIAVATLGGYVRIAVADRGCGIPRRERRRIFDKFYRIPTGDRHDVKGHGLGLYYVALAVRRHGGRIDVDSRVGGGSIFTIKLPRYGRE
ncbi:MAG: HAMP domain-containing histidine kinase [Alistipes sp.]|nr:HAMP domain-containing histidine kinase [Alistipes sp.]